MPELKSLPLLLYWARFQPGHTHTVGPARRWRLADEFKEPVLMLIQLTPLTAAVGTKVHITFYNPEKVGTMFTVDGGIGQKRRRPPPE